MATVDATAVARLIESTDSPSSSAIALAGTAVPIVTALAKGYTRGRGFSSGVGVVSHSEEIVAVITTAAARLAANTAQRMVSTTTDGRTVDVRSYFTGWTLAELAVLNRYRVRAM